MTNEKLDNLYTAWMAAEADEQAALVMLGVRDDVEMHALYERKVEAVEAAREAYQAELDRLAAAAA